VYPVEHLTLEAVKYDILIESSNCKFSGSQAHLNAGIFVTCESDDSSG
jgi:hypothetical protein